MKELLTYIARNLVEHPDSVTVTEYAGADETVLELRVAPEDMGKVIDPGGAAAGGKGGCRGGAGQGRGP